MSSVSPWTALRTVGNSSLVKATVIVPVIGYLILLNATAQDHLSLLIDDGSGADVRQLRLLLLYFGLVSLGVGSFIYSAWCPRIIKLYGSTSDFVRENREHTGSSLFGRMERELSRLSPSRHRAFVERWKIEHIDMDYSHKEYSQEMRTDLMDTLYMTLNTESLQFARFTAAWFFNIGFVLVAIPSFMVFLECAKLFAQLLKRML